MIKTAAPLLKKTQDGVDDISSGIFQTARRSTSMTFGGAQGESPLRDAGGRKTGGKSDADINVRI